MKFRKGSKVEVSSKASAAGSWLCAEIISRNHHTYSIKYGWGAATNEVVVHGVSRKAIRPCRPPVGAAGNWVTGDLVEAFDNPHWKMVVVVKVLDGSRLGVRLIGSSSEVTIHKSYLRVRQCWEDGKMGKETIASRMKSSVGDGEVSEMISSRSLKRRRSAHLFDFEGHAAKNIRLIGKDSCSKRSMVLNPSPNSEKVDAFVSQKTVLGINDKHASFHDRTAKCTSVDMSRSNNMLLVGTSLTTGADIDSCQSSVASCSSTVNDANRFPSCIRVNNSENLDYSSDAESHRGHKHVEEACSPSKVRVTCLPMCSLGTVCFRAYYRLGRRRKADRSTL